MNLRLNTPSPVQKIRITLLACFFASGACGLVYQIAWLRVMGLVFGSTTLATCTVLAGYMAGLGLGALYFGKKSRHDSQPVRLYGRLELGVGIYAFATPFLWKIMEWVCVEFYHSTHPGFWIFSVFRFILAFTALLLPTFLMGGTLPVIVQYFVKSPRETAQTVGRLYALNTAGAVLGVYLCGFYLLYTLGVWQTTVLTGALNILIYFLCRNLVPHDHSVSAAPASSLPSVKSPGLAKIPFLLLTLFGISGAVSMIYEVGWTRVLAISLGSSIYAFSTMLATFLFGIALGSWLFSQLAKRFTINLSIFAFLEALTAIFVLIGLNQFDDLPYLFVRTFAWSHGNTFLLDFGRFILCAGVMLPPTLLIGALFACFIHIYHHSGFIGADVGQAYFANTVGTILGSVLTGFILIPQIGIQKTLIGGAWLNLLIGLAAFLISAVENFSWKKAAPALGMCLLAAFSTHAVEPWNTTLLSSDTAIHPERALQMDHQKFLKSMSEREILFYKEGTSATVSVTRTRDNLALAVNGKTDASTDDTFTQFLLGHLPFFIQPDAKSALVIGLGSASTIAAVASHPVQRIDAVELEKEVTAAAGHFQQLNRGALQDPRVRIHHNDGRNFLLLNPERYDVIISEPSNPWMAGVANLFSFEHYQTMRARLNKNGVVCQWLHAYSMSTQDLQMIIKTFSQVFPNTSLWTSYYPDLMLIGTEKPVVFDANKLREVFARPHVASDLKPHGIESAMGFFANYWLNDAEIRRLSLGGKINSDNYPILEFSAPRYLYQQTFIPNLFFLNSFGATTFPDIQNLRPPLEKNAAFFRDLARGYFSKRFTQKSESAIARAESIEPGSPANALMAAELAIVQQKPDLAAGLLTRLLLRDPKNAKGHFLLGQIAHQTKKMEDAYLHLRIALRLEMQNTDYLKEYFKVVCETERYDEAVQLFTRIKNLGLAGFDMWASFAVLSFQKAPPAEQAQIATDLIARYPRFPAGYLRLGALFENANALPQAISVYSQMAKEIPLDGISRYQLGRIFTKLGREKEAQKAFKTAFRLNPDLQTSPSA